MQQNNSTSAASSEKRDPGFARIRKGLLAHLPGMSGNAVKLYLMLQFKACWFGVKRGWVEASFDDMARWCGWSTKTIQRNLEELETKPYIEVERAANQHELTRIKILKYDLEESTSAVDKSDQSSTVGVDCALDRALDSAVDSAADKPVHSKPAILQNPQDLQAPKKLKEVKAVKEQKKETANAVRRRFDAELLADRTPLFGKEKLQNRLEEKIESTPSIQGEAGELHHQSFSSLKRKKKLEARIADKLMETGNTLDRELNADERKAFAFIKYKPINPRNLPGGFVEVVQDVYEDHKEELSPGNLCSRVIDHCMREQQRHKDRRLKTLGLDPSEYYFPTDFVEHRNRLRAEECGQTLRATAEVRA